MSTIIDTRASSACETASFPAGQTTSISTQCLGPNTIGVIIAPADRRNELRKRWSWLAVDDSGTRRHHPAGELGTWNSVDEVTNGNGRWFPVESHGKAVAPGRIEQHTYVEHDVPDLPAMKRLLDALEREPTKSIIQGSLVESERQSALPDGLLVLKRNRQNYVDVASTWLFIDVDGLPVGYDVAEASREEIEKSLEDVIAKALPELSDCSFVVSHTGSAGIKGGPNELRVRLVFQLSAPMMLRQKKRLLARAKASEPKLDDSIYTPERLIFTAPPLLTALYMDGPHTRACNMARPVSGCWLVEREHDTVELDAAVVAASTARERLADAAADFGVAIGGRSLESLIAAIGADPAAPYDAPIHSLVSSLAWRTPDADADNTLARYLALVRRRIRETSEPARIDERLAEHTDLDRWHRKWREARRRKLESAFLPAAASAPAPAAVSAPVDIAAARAQLAAKVKAVADRIIGGEAVHALVTAPPGFGKTQAMLSVVDEARLANKRIVVLAPTHTLAAQIVADLQAHARTLPLTSTFTHDQLAVRIRHHKGRRQPGMCTDAVHGARAALMEASGISPKATACADCPAAECCAWLQQAEDDGPGVIVTTHANMLRNDYGTNKSIDLYIVDENAVSVFLGADASADKPTINGLDSGANAIRRRKRKTDQGLPAIRWRVSQELQLMRQLLQAALRSALSADEDDRNSHVVHRECVAALFESTAWRIYVDDQPIDIQGRSIDRALALEAELQQDLISRLKGAKITTPATRNDAAALQISRRAQAALEAIKTSHALGRDYVFGLRVFRQTVRDDTGSRRHQERYWIEPRRVVPPAIVSKGGIWLDGTANADVWRATLSPDGASIKTGFITTPPVSVSGLTVTQYADRTHAKAMHAPKPVSPGDAEAEAIAKLESEADNLNGQAHLLRTAPVFAGFTAEAIAADATAAAKRFAAQRMRAGRTTRKLRGDANLARLWRFVVWRACQQLHSAPARTAAPDVLLVAQKGVIPALKALGLPSNVACAHFGALRGLNAYKEVRVAIIAGRPALANDSLEMLTEALHMHNPAVREIGRATAWGTAADAIATRTGSVSITSEQHPDPHCRAFASTITQAEVLQAVARIRPYDRCSSNPCEVHVFGQHPTGLVVHNVAFWADAERSWAQIALAYGVLFERPETNQTAYAGLVPLVSHGAAQPQRDAWIDALVASTGAPAMTLGAIPIDSSGSAVGSPNRDKTQSHLPAVQLPEALPGTGLALAVFTTPPTPDSPKPQKQHALLHPAHGPAAIERALGCKLARFDWLPAAAAAGLLQQAFEKRAAKAVKAAEAQRASGISNMAREYEAQRCSAALAHQRSWPEVARELWGWAV